MSEPGRILVILMLMLSLCACGRADPADKTVIVLRETAVPEATSAPDSTTPPESPAPTQAPDASDWYGWWRMDHCSGDWEHMYGYYWDCCAEITDEDGALHVLLWDEDLPKDTSLAAAQLTERDGILHCITGTFLDRELGPDDWLITQTRDECGPLLHVEGNYEAVGKGGFWYEIFLRPWGSLWPGNEDEKPYSYENWYLPLIEAGADMPDQIG